MILRINTINIVYGDTEIGEIQVHFNAYGNGENINISGHLPLTPEQYEGKENLDVLEQYVRNHISSAILDEQP